MVCFGYKKKINTGNTNLAVGSHKLLKNHEKKLDFFLSRTVFSGGEFPTVLQEIDLSILSNDDCGHRTLPNIMVCAKNPKGSSCMVRIYYFGMNFSTLKYSMLTLKKNSFSKNGASEKYFFGSFLI